MADIMRANVGTRRQAWTDGTYWSDQTGWLEDLFSDAMFPAGGDGENVKFTSQTTVKHGKLDRRNRTR